MKTPESDIKNTLKRASLSTLAAIDTTVNETTKRVDNSIAPFRDSFMSRYPILFAILTTLGVTATFLGLEKILLSFTILDRYPIILLAFGVGVLSLTGTLYKKIR